MIDQSFATICSMLPYQLTESKPGLNPNEYIIPKAAASDFNLTIIPNNVFYLVNPDPLSDAKEVRNIKVPVPAIEVAQSIINDFVSSNLAVMPPEAVPGLFAVRGDWTDKKAFAKEFIPQMMAFRSYQNNWFKNLVDIADDTWAKTRSPLGISDIQRDACISLGFKRDWINPPANEELEKCPVCKNAINPGALKCVSCGTVLNKLEYEKVLAGVK